MVIRILTLSVSTAVKLLVAKKTHRYIDYIKEILAYGLSRHFDDLCCFHDAMMKAQL